MALPLSYNVRSLLVRWKVTLLAIFGIGCVATVFVVLLAMLAGFRLALRSTGSPDNAIVVQRGSGSELTSFSTREAADIVAADARVARAADGAPLVSREIVIIANLPRRADGAPTNVTLRGVSAMAFQVRRGIKIVAGRAFKPGLNEVIVGRRIAERVRGLDIGARLTVQKRDWEVVGQFDADGSSFESEIWGDLDAMAPAFQRTGGQNSMTVRLLDPAALKAFDDQVQADPRFQLHLVQEQQYYEDEAGPVPAQLMALAGFVALVMGTGAVFGAMNTMYALIAARTREIGTLRALGFTRLGILTSFVVESLLLGLAGGIVGCLVSFAANGYTTATGQTSSFSEMAFAFRITPGNLTAGILFSLAMGFFGGLLPAWRAARMGITSALREA